MSTVVAVLMIKRRIHTRLECHVACAISLVADLKLVVVDRELGDSASVSRLLEADRWEVTIGGNEYFGIVTRWVDNYFDLHARLSLDDEYLARMQHVFQLSPIWVFLSLALESTSRWQRGMCCVQENLCQQMSVVNACIHRWWAYSITLQ